MSAPAGDGVAAYPWERPLGAHPMPGGGVEFRVWAPHANSIALRVGERDVDLHDAGYGVYAGVVDAGAGDDYWFVLDGRALPDPCSRWQPEGIRGPSRVAEVSAPASFTAARDARHVIYELHVGTFIDQGTFDAAIEHLPRLAELGVTAVELMPVAEFPGERGWGYDGVYISRRSRPTAAPRDSRVSSTPPTPSASR